MPKKLLGSQRLAPSEGLQSPGYPALDQASQPGLPPLIIHPLFSHSLSANWARQGKVLFSFQNNGSMIPPCSVFQMDLTIQNKVNLLPVIHHLFLTEPSDPVWPVAVCLDLQPNLSLLCTMDQTGLASSLVGLEVPALLKLAFASLLY